MFTNCDVCAVKFSSRSNMMRHKRLSHGQQILYVCDSCGTTFKRLDNLKQHEKKFHSDSKSAQRQETNCTQDSDNLRYKCMKCNAVFLSQEDLKEHESSHLKSIQTFICHTCSRVFDDRKRFTKHSESHRSVSSTCRKRQSQRVLHTSSSSE